MRRCTTCAGALEPAEATCSCPRSFLTLWNDGQHTLVAGLMFSSLWLSVEGSLCPLFLTLSFTSAHLAALRWPSVSYLVTVQEFKLNVLHWQHLRQLGALLAWLAASLGAPAWLDYYTRDLGHAAVQEASASAPTGTQPPILLYNALPSQNGQ